MAETGCLGGVGFAEGHLGFEQEAGERAVEFAVDGGGGGDAGLSLVLGLANEGGASLANDARGAGDGEVELKDQSCSGVLVEQICSGGVGGSEAFVDEDEGEVAAAEGGEGGAAAGSGFDLGAEFEAEGFRDGVRGGFGGDEQDGWGHVWIVDSGWWLVVRR